MTTWYCAGGKEFHFQGTNDVGKNITEIMESLGESITTAQLRPSGDSVLHYVALGDEDSEEIAFSVIEQYETQHSLPAINITNKDGQTALHYAVKHGHPRVAGAFLISGMDPDAKDLSLGNTALHYAVERACQENATPSDMELLHIMLSWCDLAVLNSQGQSVLHIAASVDCFAVVSLLLRSGSDANLTDKQGVSAFSMLLASSHADQYSKMVESSEMNLKNEKRMKSQKEIGASDAYATNWFAIMGQRVKMFKKNASFRSAPLFWLNLPGLSSEGQVRARDIALFLTINELSDAQSDDTLSSPSSAAMHEILKRSTSNASLNDAMRNRELERQLAQAENENQRLSAEVSSLKQLTTTLEADNYNLTGEVERLRPKDVSASDILAGLNADSREDEHGDDHHVDVLVVQLQECLKKLAESESREQKLETEVATKDELLEELMRELSASSPTALAKQSDSELTSESSWSRLKLLETELNEKTLSLENATLHSEEFQGKLNELTVKYEQSESELKSCRQKIETFESNAAEVENRLQEAKSEVAKAKGSVASYLSDAKRKYFGEIYQSIILTPPKSQKDNTKPMAASLVSCEDLYRECEQLATPVSDWVMFVRSKQWQVMNSS